MLALIPARGGSKGLPQKNILDFCGKPLIAHTIEAALKAKSVSEVFVSTDCEKIAGAAKNAGALVPFLRHPALATDTAKAIDVYLEFLEKLAVMRGRSVEAFMVLLPTCPLRNADDIDAAHELFLRTNADSVVSYTQEAHPVRWHKYLTADGRFENIFEDTIENRQAERTSYYPNGAIYIFKSKLLKQGKYYSDNSFCYLMPRDRSVDIDTIDDFELAEFLSSK
ncbi:acylneuraminate cytidylyltransferase family protein [Bowmanella denitrificans]|uniref:Acylneuraminate cytidylyltransferase family protein n=1 Tax=Bowmanella denitrificans TaxID=366582 RepID=A0ABN0X2W3_9ALTE